MKVKWCPYCQKELEMVDTKHYCPDCRAFIYIQVECLVDSPLLEKKVVK